MDIVRLVEKKILSVAEKIIAVLGMFGKIKLPQSGS